MPREYMLIDIAPADVSFQLFFSANRWLAGCGGEPAYQRWRHPDDASRPAFAVPDNRHCVRLGH